MVDIVVVPHGQVFLGGEGIFQCPVAGGGAVGKALHDDLIAKVTAHDSAGRQQRQGVGQGGGVEKALCPVRVLGKMINGLIALNGGGQTAWNQQSAQGAGGKQEGEGASKHGHFLSDGGAHRAPRDGRACVVG